MAITLADIKPNVVYGIEGELVEGEARDWAVAAIVANVRSHVLRDLDICELADGAASSIAYLLSRCEIVTPYSEEPDAYTGELVRAYVYHVMTPSMPVYYSRADYCLSAVGSGMMEREYWLRLRDEPESQDLLDFLVACMDDPHWGIDEWIPELVRTGLVGPEEQGNGE